MNRNIVDSGLVAVFHNGFAEEENAVACAYAVGSSLERVNAKMKTGDDVKLLRIKLITSCYGGQPNLPV